MEEGGGVNELNGCSHGDMICTLIAAEFGGEQQEGRTEPLATTVDQILSYLGEAGDLGGEPALKLLFHLLHIVFD